MWVEVCDSLGACTPGSTTLVPVAPGEARTVDALVEDVRAHVRRCELTSLRRLAATAVVSYTVSILNIVILKILASIFRVNKKRAVTFPIKQCYCIIPIRYFQNRMIFCILLVLRRIKNLLAVALQLLRCSR